MSPSRKNISVYPALFAIIVVLLGLWAWRMTRSAGPTSLQPSESQGSAIEVRATNGAFSPSRFEMGHLDTVTLNITAVDQDYVFQHADWGIDVSLPKGQTTAVTVDALSVGDSTFSCGPDCQGTIAVRGKSDEED